MKSGFFIVFLVTIGSCIATYILLTTLPGPTIAPESSHVNYIDPVVSMPEEIKSLEMGPLRPFHVALTATADPYSRWQSRIMYYWYKEVKAQPDGSAEMGGFTRVLHTGKPDRLMDEIPTFVVDPLPPGVDRASNGLLYLIWSMAHVRRTMHVIMSDQIKTKLLAQHGSMAGPCPLPWCHAV